VSARYDAIIIGAGIIGACTAFELAKRGWRTLNLDKLPAAGYGSTSSSCAIIRTHYSTLDGSALAYEGYFRWDDWAGYLETADERGTAPFHKTGCLVMKTAANDHLRTVCAHQDALGIPWEDWGPERIAARFPFYDLRAFGPTSDENTMEAAEDAREATVSSYMNSSPITVNPETPARELIELMLLHRVGALPVTDVDSGDLLGIVSYVDLLRMLQETLEPA